jgi:CRISPR system Cascade subunit CasD
MSTLLLRLAGPMQSWGTQSRFTVRDTGMEPSKSGVIGLLCAALGRPRWEPLDDLIALRLGIRVDREGRMEQDYQTAGGVQTHHGRYGVALADGKGTRPVVSTRYYLADADFLVGLEGDAALLERIDAALAHPVWPLALGRKAYVPGAPIRLPDEEPCGPGLRAGALEEVLRAYPWPAPRYEGDRVSAGPLRLVMDAEDEATAFEVRNDVPLSFAVGNRRFTSRAVAYGTVTRGEVRS